MPTPTTATLTTTLTPGAIAVVQLHGPEARRIVGQLGAVELTGRSRLVEIAGIDEAIITGLRDDWFQVMPHGGVRVVQHLMQRLEELGAIIGGEADARELYPEAASDIEAEMLAALARAASPAAIDLLLVQPARWADAVTRPLDVAMIERQTAALDRLVTPPTVVLAGRPNVGKSTLSNLVMGRAASITADLPGTTRDWVAGLAELRTAIGEVAVKWFDTPGLRESGDPIETRAIELARGVVASADVIIAMRDPEIDWLDAAELPRLPDVWVANKSDLGTPNAERTTPFRVPRSEIRVSSLTGEGLDKLAAAVGRALGLAEVDTAVPWAFSPSLKRLLRAGDREGLVRYTAP